MTKRKEIYIGLILILIGVILLLKTFNILNISFSIFSLWPIIFVFIGLEMISKNIHSIILGLIIVSMGILWILKNTGILLLNFNLISLFFALFLIYLGVILIYGYYKINKYRTGENKNSYEGEFIINIFGDFNKKFENEKFKGIFYFIIFGDINIEFEDIEIEKDKAYISGFTIFGDQKIKIRETLFEKFDFISKAGVIFGDIITDFHEKQNSLDETNKIIIDSFSLFGDIIIKKV
jgi:hypothetical protein